jgi:hypothetical protein
MRADLYYVAIAICASLPDVCANLEAADGQAGWKGYKRWFRENVGDALGRFNEDECYELRCGVLHRGATRGSKDGHSTYERFVFVGRESNLILEVPQVVGPEGSRHLVIDVRGFCETMIASAEKWEGKVAKNPAIQANMGRLIRRYPEGLPNFMKGISLIA